MYVVFFTHCAGIPQFFRHGIDYFHHILFALRLRFERTAIRQQVQRLHGAGPGTEVFAGKFFICTGFQVIVHFTGIEAFYFAVFIVLEQFLAGNVPYFFKQAGQ